MTSSLKNKILYFYRHPFVRSVATLQFGSFWSYLIQAVVGVLLARLLQPERYGVYNLAFGLASLVFISTGLQETITVVLGEHFVKKDWSATREALAFFLKLTAIFSLASLVIIFFLPRISSALYHNPTIGLYAAVIVLASIISSGLFSITGMMLQVTGRIRSLMVFNFSDQAVRFGLALALVLTGLGVFGAVLGHLAGAVVLLAVSVIVWGRLRQANPIPGLTELLRSVRRVSLKRYASFSIRVAVDKNVAMLYSILPILLSGIYLSTSQVSFFKISFAYVNLALTLLIPISTLLNFEIPKMRILEPGRVRANFIKVSVCATLVSTILTLGAIVTAPFVFRIIYGASFAPSARYVIGFLIYGALFGIGIALGSMWRAIDKVNTSILINLIVLGIGIPTGLLLISHLGIWGAIIMVSAWYSISHLISFFYLASYLHHNQV